MEFVAGTGEDADALAVGAVEGPIFDDSAQRVLDALPRARDHLADAEFEGKAGQSVLIRGGAGTGHSNVLFVGLGDGGPEQVRRASGTAARLLARSRTVATSLHGGTTEGGEALALGFILGAYTFHRHKSDPKPSLIESVHLVAAPEDVVAACGVGVQIGDAVCFARDLINEPAIEKAPDVLARIAAEMADQAGIGVSVMDESDIESAGLGGLRGVSLGAANPPRLVELTYDPDGANAFLALVGKGIVFDSGGLSLKPSESMETMKTDMSGAAAVIAATKAIASLGLPVKVVAIAPLTENMPGGSALRPGDIIRPRNKKTVEVLNTDAEGRLVLADGLSLAAEQEPDLIVDVATLTGGCVVALGKKIAGLFGDDEAVGRVEAAAETAGERVWRLPLPDDYRKMIDSDVADMKNTGGRPGSAITAALFLKEFVADRTWAHLDIAGPARSDDDEHYVTKGGTGFGVRTLIELARQMA